MYVIFTIFSQKLIICR